MVLSAIVLFNRIVYGWNSLVNHIREANCIATLKKNVVSLIMDTQNICISMCIYFCYISISGDIP